MNATSAFPQHVMLLGQTPQMNSHTAATATAVINACGYIRKHQNQILIERVIFIAVISNTKYSDAD